jgi:hypothetical protein
VEEIRRKRTDFSKKLLTCLIANGFVLCCSRQPVSPFMDEEHAQSSLLGLLHDLRNRYLTFLLFLCLSTRPNPCLTLSLFLTDFAEKPFRRFLGCHNSIETKVKLNISRTDVYFLAFIVVSTRNDDTGKAHNTHIDFDWWEIISQRKKTSTIKCFMEKCMNIFLYIPRVMLFIFNLHTIFSPLLFMFEVDEQKNERHSETWTNKQKKWQKV